MNYQYKIGKQKLGNMEVVTPADLGIDETSYTAIVRCLNCGNQWEEHIPHGTLVSEWVKSEAVHSCQNCKCDDAKIVGGVTC